MTIAVLLVMWGLSLFAALAVGFRWSKRVPYSRTLREELARRARLMRVYVQATVAVFVPAYGRRWRRQQATARRTYLDNLEEIQRAEWSQRQE